MNTFWHSPFVSLLTLTLLSVMTLSCGSEKLIHSEVSGPRRSHPAAARDAHAASPATLPDGLGRPELAQTDGTNPTDLWREQRNAHALRHFYESLEAIDAQELPFRRVRITHIGDSHTASDTFTGPARDTLQERFGEAGRGYLFAGTPWSSYRQRGAEYSMSSDWSGGVGIRGGFSGFSLGGARVYTDKADAWLERGPCRRCDNNKIADVVRIHYLRQPQGGSFRVMINGQVEATIHSDSPTEEIGVAVIPIAPSEAHLRIETEGDGRVTVFGTSFEHEARGLIYDSLGVNGAQLRHYLQFNEAFTQEELRSLAPDLIIIAFGANEAVSSRYQVRDPQNQALELLQKLEGYRGEILSLIERYREAAPQASCLLLLPPDMLTSDNTRCEPYEFDSEHLSGNRCVQQPPLNYPGIINAQRFAAMQAGCAIWNQQHAMGGEGAMDIWRELRFAARDGIHLSSRGYELLAEQFTTDLIENYELWREQEPLPLTTTVIFPELATSARK